MYTLYLKIEIKCWKKEEKHIVFKGYEREIPFNNADDRIFISWPMLQYSVDLMPGKKYLNKN